MLNSKKERMLAILTLFLVVVLGGDRLVLVPFFSARTELKDELKRLEAKQRDNTALLSISKRIGQKWSEMAPDGLAKDASGAEGLANNTVAQWAQDTGLNLTSVETEREKPNGRLRATSFKARGQGDMRQVTSFLQLFAKTTLPIRLIEVKLDQDTRDAKARGKSIVVRFSVLWGNSESGPPPVQISGGGLK